MHADVIKTNLHKPPWYIHRAMHGDKPRSLLHRRPCRIGRLATEEHGTYVQCAALETATHGIMHGVWFTACRRPNRNMLWMTMAQVCAEELAVE